jgi:hypothetical protein
MRLIILGTAILSWALIVGSANVYLQRVLQVANDSSLSRFVMGAFVAIGIIIGAPLINRLNSRLSNKQKP